MITETYQVLRVEPVRTVESLIDYLRASKTPVKIRGAGTWQGAGRPTRAVEVVKVEGIKGVVEYVPGDLTITVRAGTSLAEIETITGAEGQWLGIDPAGTDSGTIGATIASASSGPLAHGVGRARDIVLGLEVVTGDGRIVRSGGKVVKNVAGFDVVRLQTGAWGTLGIITEVSLRLRALPEVDETVAISFDPRKPLTAELVKVRDLPLAALALELLGPQLATTLGLPNAFTLLVRLAGNETRVRAQRASLATLGDVVTMSGEVWRALRTLETDLCAVARVSQLPTELARTWTHVHETLSLASLTPAIMHASVGRGIVRCIMLCENDDAPFAEFQTALNEIARSIAPPGGHVVWERLPPSVWKHVPSAVADGLSSGLQRAFDPDRRLNVGILGDTE